MANDRMYLKCKGCGEEFCLGKTYLDGYFIYNEDTFGQKLQEFYDRHKYCVEPEMYGQKIQTFELVYDSSVYDAEPTQKTNEL